MIRGLIYKKKSAFTLAEVLTTLMIIGVVAVIVMLVFNLLIRQKLISSQAEVTKVKFSTASDKMLSLSGVNGYDGTLSYVKELSKHFHIVKICDNSDVQDCWSSKKVITEMLPQGWDISKTKEPVHFGILPKEGTDFDKTAAFMTADGIPFIVTYDKACDINPNNAPKWSEDKLSSSTACISGIYDVNGSSPPNELNKDVFTFNSANNLGVECAFTMNGACFTKAQKVQKPATMADCLAIMDKDYCKVEESYWVGAMHQCGGREHLPTKTEAEEITKTLYDNLNGKRGDYNAARAASYGITERAPFWTSEMYNKSGNVHAYATYQKSYDWSPRPANSDNLWVICKQ
ncbi:MAG: prepilin-type N-terminal cleavage/methylation domain-containing protein [bacterium]|nr:prepilin-type N-terminal cleavage/methylation domain-containing protein [bacterium]